MFILDLIEKLREKPVAYRKRVVFFVASVLTGLIVVVWLSTLDYRFDASENNTATIEKQLRPFEEIKTTIGSFYTSIKQISSEFFGGAGTSTATSTAEVVKK